MLLVNAVLTVQVVHLAVLYQIIQQVVCLVSALDVVIVADKLNTRGLRFVVVDKTIFRRKSVINCFLLQNHFVIGSQTSLILVLFICTCFHAEF